MLKRCYKLQQEFNRLKNCHGENSSFLHSYHNQLIHTTTAIEGNTMILNDIYCVLQYGVTIHGKSLKEHLEIVNLNDALNYIHKALNSNMDITTDFINYLHYLTTLKTLPLENCGQYRQVPVYLTTTTYIPPKAENVPALMQDLLDWYMYRNDQYYDLLETIFMFHQKFVSIHPYVDGNGRVARLILNYMLLQNGFPSIIVESNNRHEYFTALDQANWDLDNTQPIVDFLARCLITSLEKHIESMK